MSNRVRILLLGGVLLFLGIEVVVRWAQAPKSCVQIVNQGDAVIENLVVSFARSQVGVAPLGAGDSARVWLSGNEKGTLTLAFKQAGNPMSGFQVADFDPHQMRRDGLKLVLRVRANEVERSMDDEETSTPMGHLGARVRQWISSELDPPEEQ